MEHSSKSSNKRMLFVELKDESTPMRVARLTVLGEHGVLHGARRPYLRHISVQMDVFRSF
eukprot:1148825-Amphidinium_carterae.1